MAGVGQAKCESDRPRSTSDGRRSREETARMARDAATVATTWAVSPSAADDRSARAGSQRGSEAVPAVERGHHRVAEALLDGDAVSVHGDVEAAEGRPEHEKRQRQRELARRVDGQGEAEAHEKAGHPAQSGAAEAVDQRARQRHGGDAARRQGEQEPAEHARPDPEPLLDERNVRHPAAGQKAVRQEDEHDGEAGAPGGRPVVRRHGRRPRGRRFLSPAHRRRGGLRAPPHRPRPRPEAR